jgi:nucleoside-diphosphate-sugar epimerase
MTIPGTGAAGMLGEEVMAHLSADHEATGVDPGGRRHRRPGGRRLR